MTRRVRAEVPAKIVAKVRSICRRLPESYEEKAWVGTRWMVRKRNFAHLVRIDGGWPPAYARAAGSDGPLVVLTFRAAGDLYDTLRNTGPPFFHAAWGTLWGTKVIGMEIGARVDWDEVAVLVTESYRLLAPAKLVSP
jgi:YjbR